MLKSKIKKIGISIIMIVIVLLVHSSNSSAASLGDNEEKKGEYYMINVSTGEMELQESVTRDYYSEECIETELQNNNDLISPMEIIGSRDERVRVLTTTIKPYSSVVYGEVTFPNGDTGTITAVMIYKNLAITAGHCAYDKDKWRYSKYSIISCYE